MRPRHQERHRTDRIGWLRAAVLGANDGIVSTASLIVGVAAAGTARAEVLVAGLAALVAGAMSMAAGEYVSVSSQSDTEKADPEAERRELIGIYRERGLSEDLAVQVADQLTARDAMKAHARDELGISAHLTARPLQAAVTSAATFAVGAALPMACAALVPMTSVVAVVAGTSLVFLAALGALAAYAGGASMRVAAARVVFWGAAAMALTALVGRLFGTAVA
jgi:VIT1/CCC1 family predicted Fe2+/Mn2+ transporter